MRLEEENIDKLKNKVIYAVNDRSMGHMWQFEILHMKEDEVHYNWRICYVNKGERSVDDFFNQEWHKSYATLSELQTIEFFVDKESAYMYLFTNGQFINE